MRILIATLIWDPIERLLWGVAITLLSICGAIFLYRAYKREDKKEKQILYGFTSLILGLTVHRMVLFAADLQHTGSFINFGFYGTIDIFNPEFQVFYNLNIIILAIGLAIFNFNIERSLQRTKYIVTTVNLGLFCVWLVLLVASPFELSYYFGERIIFLGFMFSYVSLIFLLTKYSSMEFKAVASMIFMGVSSIMYGNILYVPEVKELQLITLYAAPLSYILGPILMLSTVLIDPKHFSRAAKYWFIVGILMFLDIWVIVIVGLMRGITPDLLIIGLTINVFYSYIIFKFFKIIKYDPGQGKIEQTQDFLKIFTRPQLITEKEISVHKEKKICLVCKNSLGRFNIYLCIECGALYCEKCANILADMENACWVCETPFDDSKPMKLPEKKEEKDIIKEDIGKKRIK